MKYIFTTLLLGIASMTFAQKDLGLKRKYDCIYDADIADDGSFTIRDRSVLYSYDKEGNIIAKIKENKWWVHFYDPSRKLWFGSNLNSGRFTVVQMDANGNITRTLVKNKCITGDYVDEIVIGKDGKINFYLTSSTEDLLPLVVVKFNPEDKTSEVINFRDIRGITGKSFFIGEREGETYFGNYILDKANPTKIDVKIYSVNEKKELKSVQNSNFSFKNKLNYPIVKMVPIIPMDNKWTDELYFSVNVHVDSEGEPGNGTGGTTYCVFKIDEDDNFSRVNISAPGFDLARSRHFPIKIKETDKDPLFIVSDSFGTRVLYTANFSSGESSMILAFERLKIEDLMFNHEKYSELFEMGKDKHAGVFKVCDGTAKLITITKRGVGTLYTQEEVK